MSGLNQDLQARKQRENLLFDDCFASGLPPRPEFRAGKVWQINLFFKRHLKIRERNISGSTGPAYSVEKEMEERMMTNGKKIIVGIGGGSASGKTTFVNRLQEIIGKENLCVLHHDSYYRDRSGISPEARAGINYDHPSALETDLLANHLEQLLRGEDIEVPVYDFRTHCRENRSLKIKPRPLILVEGILVLSEASLAKYLDYKIFIELEPDLLLARRISRDITERGRTVEASLRQYTETTRPMLKQFVLPSRQNADLIISGETCFEEKSVSVIGLGLKSLLDLDGFRPPEK